MPRVFLRALLLAGLAGAGTTFLVSAALAAFLPHQALTLHHYARYGVQGRPDAKLAIDRFSRRGMERRCWRVEYAGANYFPPKLLVDYSMTLRARGFRQFLAQDLWGKLGPLASTPPSRGSGTEDARGWPALAFWCEIVATPNEHSPTTVIPRGGLPISATDGSASVGHFRCIPFRPIWRGVLIDTGVYAALWLVPLAGWPGIRAGLRRRRGRCPTCAYDLSATSHPGCPECGWNR